MPFIAKMSPKKVRTKAVPRLHHPPFKSARQFCGFYCENAGRFCLGVAESDVVVPALKRTRSEQEANKKRTFYLYDASIAA
jgi:hypothetical protein